MLFGLYCEKFDDYKPIIKKMKKGGFDVLIIPLSSIFDLKNVSMYFLEKSLGVESKKYIETFLRSNIEESGIIKTSKPPFFIFLIIGL